MLKKVLYQYGVCLCRNESRKVIIFSRRIFLRDVPYGAQHGAQLRSGGYLFSLRSPNGTNVSGVRPLWRRVWRLRLPIVIWCPVARLLTRMLPGAFAS